MILCREYQTEQVHHLTEHLNLSNRVVDCLMQTNDEESALPVQTEDQVVYAFVLKTSSGATIILQ